ncbi:MAG: MinD/ParA family protein [Methylococcaceae bacterium]|nr:MinD/ParA family protein [Methylococcaceae bacterium]
MIQPKPVRVLAVASGKGGVGKTNVSINLGCCLSNLGRTVALMDADMGLANVDVLLGLQPKYNLSHVLSGERTLEEIIVVGPAGLRVVPGASGIQRMAELSAAEQSGVISAFGAIGEDIDVLIVDTAAGISNGVVTFTRACQDIILVVCDEPTSLTDVYAFIKLMNRDYGIFRFQILANMVRDERQGRQLFDKLSLVTDRYLDVTINYLGAIPQDDNLRKSVQKQTPVSLLFPQSKSAEAFRNLARKVDSLPMASQASGRLEFFVERMIQFSRAVHA